MVYANGERVTKKKKHLHDPNTKLRPLAPGPWPLTPDPRSPSGHGAMTYLQTPPRWRSFRISSTSPTLC